MAIEPVLIGIGANLPGPDGASPLALCERAVRALAGQPAPFLPGLRLVARSRWYRSAPIPATTQPDYVNAVARLHGKVDPATLLAALQALETAAGRVRGLRNAPRPLDLDIIAMGDTLRDAPDPILPHPRAHLRAFVLAPLSEVAPEWVHPRLRQTAASLLAALPAQDISVI